MNIYQNINLIIKRRQVLGAASFVTTMEVFYSNAPTIRDALTKLMHSV